MPAINQRDPLSRFGDRAILYVKYRPGYPRELIDFLLDNYHLDDRLVIADVGAGTGFMAELFLKYDCAVYGIEPNDEMRLIMEKRLHQFPQFKSIAATAECTTLLSESTDLITCAQSFHWFDREKTKKEFRRILKPDGILVIVWNTRRTDTPFLRDYENLLLKYSIDYQQVDHRKVTKKEISEFFIPYQHQKVIFPNKQVIDFNGLKGRLLSSSYVPRESHPSFNDMIHELKLIFDRHQQENRVEMLYDCEVYHGRFK